MDINEIKPMEVGDRLRHEMLNAIVDQVKENTQEIDGMSSGFQGDVVPSFNFTSAPKGIYAPLESGTYQGGVVVDLQNRPLTQLVWNGVILKKKGDVEIVVPPAVNKIPDWTAGTYTIGKQVNHNGQIWAVKTGVASTTGEPGVSADWVPKTWADIYGESPVPAPTFSQGTLNSSNGNISTTVNNRIRSVLTPITGLINVSLGSNQEARVFRYDENQVFQNYIEYADNHEMVSVSGHIRILIKFKDDSPISPGMGDVQITIRSDKFLLTTQYEGENGIIGIEGSVNKYNGEYREGRGLNEDGTLRATSNDVSELVPVSEGPVTISAPGFPLGVVSTSVFGYTQNTFEFGGVRLSPSGTAPSVEVEIPAGIKYIANLVRLNSWSGVNNAQYLLVTQPDGYEIKSGGDSITTTLIVKEALKNDEVVTLIQGIAGSADDDTDDDGGSVIVFEEYPYYEIQPEPNPQLPTSPVQWPGLWQYKDIVLNVFETMRTANPEYINLIGDYNQTIDLELPATSIGLSFTNGTRAQHPLYLYDFKPEGYEQTVLLMASEHGSERESTMALCRFLQIMMAEYTNSPQMNYFRTKVRFLICPVVSPWAYNANSRENGVGININRNYDFNFESSDNDSQVPPPMGSECGLVYNAIKPYLNEINFGFSLHSGTGSNPYWVNAPIDAKNRAVVETVCRYLCNKNGVPFNITGVHTAVSYIAASAHYYSKIHLFPFSTVDYVQTYPEWGPRYESKSMTIFVEQLINLLIGHAYENFNVNNNHSTVGMYKPDMFSTPVSEECGHYQKLSSGMVDNVFTSKLSGFTKAVIGNVSGTEILSYTHEAAETEERTVILIGGIFTKVSQKRVIVDYEAQTYGLVDYIDGQRHVVLLSDFGKFWQADNDQYLNEVKKKTKLIIVPVANVGSVYTSNNVIYYNGLFQNGSDGSYTAIKNLLSSNKGAKVIIFNEVTEPESMVDFRFSKNYPYGWKSGSHDLKRYIDNELDVEHTSQYDEPNGVLSWAADNASCSGVEIRNQGVSVASWGSRVWSSANMTLLGEVLGNVVGKI